jgi:O-antigen/teichoic acid export membrane protein
LRIFKPSKVFLGSISGIAYVAVNIIITIVVTPYLIVALGAVTFGLWKVSRNYFNLVGIFDGKNSVNLKYLVSKSLDYNIVEINSHLSNAMKFWRLTLPLVLVSSCAVYFVLKEQIGREILDVNTEIFVLGLTLYTVVNSIIAIFLSLIAGLNRIVFVNVLNCISVIFINGALLLAAYLNVGVEGMAAGLVVAAIMLLVSVFYYTRRSFPKIRLAFVGRPKSEGFKEYSKNSLWLFLWSLFVKLSLALEVLLTPFLLGLNFVTSLVVSFLLFTASNSVSLAISSSFVPTLGQLLTQSSDDRFDRFDNLVFDSENITRLIAGLSAIFVLVFNAHFVSAWVGDHLFIGREANCVLALMTYQFALIRNKSQILDLLNFTRFKVLVAIFSIIVLSTFLYFKQSFSMFYLLLAIFMSRELVRLNFEYKLYRYSHHVRIISIRNFRPHIVSILTYVTIITFYINLNYFNSLLPGLLVFIVYSTILIIHYQEVIVRMFLNRFDD